MARSEDDEDSNESEVGCCTKYTIFIFNVIFFLVGFILVALGTYCQVDNGGIYKKMQNTGHFAMDPTLIAILIGILIFIIGFCGCLGSLRENNILLTIYIYALIFILLLEFALVLIMYFCKDKAMETIGDITQLGIKVFPKATCIPDASMSRAQTRLILEGMIPSYNSNEDLQDLIDQIQMMMKCCGINSPDDWDANMYFAANKQDETPNPFSNGVPYSCCVDPYVKKDEGEMDVNTGCGKQSRKDGLSSAIYQVGCLSAIDDWAKSNGRTLIIVIAVVLIVKAVAIVLAQNLKADIKAQKAKWVE